LRLDIVLLYIRQDYVISHGDFESHYKQLAKSQVIVLKLLINAQIFKDRE